MVPDALDKHLRIRYTISMSKVKKRWKDCSWCDHFQVSNKHEGVCKFLTDYNEAPVYVYNRFFCKKWQHEEEKKDG